MKISSKFYTPHEKLTFYSLQPQNLHSIRCETKMNLVNVIYNRGTVNELLIQFCQFHIREIANYIIVGIVKIYSVE